MPAWLTTLLEFIPHPTAPAPSAPAASSWGGNGISESSSGLLFRAVKVRSYAGALQFAGEATATRTSMTVHAALDTGVRAAARVAVRLGAARDLAHAAELQAAADARVAAAVRGIPPYVLTAPELLARWRSKL